MAGSADLAGLGARRRRLLARLLVAMTAESSRHPDASAPDLRWARDVIGGLPPAAMLHRVSGTVERGLDGAEGVPEDVRSSLRSVRERSAVRHLMMSGALDRIRQAFDAADVEWVVMKGPVVAAGLYPTVGERSYGDLDLLVDRRHYATAMRALEDLGYRHDIHNWALAEQMLAGAVGMGSPIAHADLHWHLHYSKDDRRQFRLLPDEMIRRARRLDVSGVLVPTFDSVDTLLTLGFHAARSGGHRLIWFKDIERSLAVDRPDLDELVRRCHAYHCASPVGLMLERARVLVGAEVPSEIVDALVPSSVLSLDRSIERRRGWIRLHERDTLARWLSRSVRENTTSTLATVPSRAWRTTIRRVRPPEVNESDDEHEKQAFLDAVVATSVGS